MTFAEFQASRTWCEDLGKALQDESLQGNPGNLYDGSFFIGLFSEQPRKWWLIIERSEYVSADLEQLECRLWNEFADGEINGSTKWWCTGCGQWLTESFDTHMNKCPGEAPEQM